MDDTKGTALVIPRTGQAPLSFRGQKIAESVGLFNPRPDRNRWWELIVYRTAAGKWVGYVGFMTQWPNESDYDMAEVVDSPDELLGWFLGRNVEAIPYGFPPGPQWELRQLRLKNAMLARYWAQVTELMHSLPECHHTIE